MSSIIFTAICLAQIQGFIALSSNLVFAILTALIVSVLALLLIILMDIRDKLSVQASRSDSHASSKEESFNSNCKQYYLTSREVEILKHIGTGKPYKIIASELNISEKTVKNHVRNMYEKTGVSNKMELVSRMNGS